MVIGFCVFCSSAWAAEKMSLANDKIHSVEELSMTSGEKVDANRFLGNVYLKPMIREGEGLEFPATNLVTFEPKARSAWHRHGGMILLVTDGVGYYQEKGKPAQILRRGDVVEIPEGVEHWHGATKDSWFSQMVVYDSRWKGSHGGDAPEFVSDEEYFHLQEEEWTGRPKKKFGNQMFGRAEKSVKLPTFTGNAFVNDILDFPNSAKAPNLHYVVFEPGVINNWHVHEGGQILIATDGVGFHQMEGEEVQVLRPGDVAICPPGKKHWHGGSRSSRFAHIAANVLLDKNGVQWLDPVLDKVRESAENRTLKPKSERK